jgi:hypothetical protein
MSFHLGAITENEVFAILVIGFINLITKVYISSYHNFKGTIINAYRS